jgi:hypothetical protein
VVDAFFDLADTIITVRSLIRSGMDHLPLGQPSSQATVITQLSARALTLRAISADALANWAS